MATASVLRSRVQLPVGTPRNLSQVSHAPLPLSPSSIIWHRRKLGGKQAHHRNTLAPFSWSCCCGWCLADGQRIENHIRPMALTARADAPFTFIFVRFFRLFTTNLNKKICKTINIFSTNIFRYIKGSRNT